MIFLLRPYIVDTVAAVMIFPRFVKHVTLQAGNNPTHPGSLIMSCCLACSIQVQKEVSDQNNHHPILQGGRHIFITISPSTSRIPIHFKACFLSFRCPVIPGDTSRTVPRSCFWSNGSLKAKTCRVFFIKPIGPVNSFFTRILFKVNLYCLETTDIGYWQYMQFDLVTLRLY